MSLVLKSTGSTFTKYVGTVAYPITRGLMGAYYFGSAETNQLRNYASGGAPLVASGSPTVNTNSITVDRLNGYDTGLMEPSEFTLIVAAVRPSSPPAGFFIGNAQLNKYGISLGHFNGSLTNFLGRTSGVLSYAPAFAAGAGTSCFLTFRYSSGTNQVTTHQGTAGVLTSTSTSIVSSRLVGNATNTIKIGIQSYDVTWTQSATIYAAAVHDVGLTDTEVDAVYQSMRLRLGALGVTI